MRATRGLGDGDEDGGLRSLPPIPVDGGGRYPALTWLRLNPVGEAVLCQLIDWAG